MPFRIVTLKCNPVVAPFDEAGLQDYLKDKEILSIREHFFGRSDIPLYHPHHPVP